MAQISSPEFPGERLVVCRNSVLAAERARKREDLLAAIEKDLAKIQTAIAGARNPLRGAAIALKVGAVLGRRARWPSISISPSPRTRLRPRRCRHRRRGDTRWLLRAAHLAAGRGHGCRRGSLAYKRLAHGERAFRSLKSIDLDIRPVHHRRAGRVRAHIFLCMLAYYMAWHIRRTLAPLLFEDHERLDAAASSPRARPRGVRRSPVRKSRLPLAPRRAAARPKSASRCTASAPYGDLATLTRNTMRFGDALAMTAITTTAIQRLLLRPVPGNAF